MTRPRFGFAALGVLMTAVAVAALFSACTAATPDTAPAAPDPAPAVPETVTDGLDAPWSIAFFDETPLVSERDTARVLELDDAGEAREVSVIDGVSPGGEGGLLGIAVHESFLYAYSTGEEENRVERYAVSGDSGSLVLGEAEPVLEGIPAAGHHNGGRIAFGPDEMLYLTTGDAGSTTSAQDLDSLAGKILRATPEGDVPEDNPLPGSHVYSYGHRNPQGIGWDAEGRLYASEFGQNTWDELNMIEPGGNYGWPEVEGMAGRDEFVDPVQQWEPVDASPSGIAIADGSLYIANLRGERLREVPLDALDDSVEYWVGEHGRLRDVAVAPDGALWVLTNNTDGRGSPGAGDDRILRFVPSA